ISDCPLRFFSKYFYIFSSLSLHSTCIFLHRNDNRYHCDLLFFA
ncbi:hypothetical protein HMPREF9533_02608, partial [Escherichia coli MS 60-1]